MLNSVHILEGSRQNYGVKIAKVLIIIGGALVGFGVIFHQQGMGNVGPESSFMYYNPDWIYHGLEIIVAGAATLGFGIILQKRASRSR